MSKFEKPKFKKRTVNLNPILVGNSLSNFSHFTFPEKAPKIVGKINLKIPRTHNWHFYSIFPVSDSG
jgi:hypothetical protein